MPSRSWFGRKRSSFSHRVRRSLSSEQLEIRALLHADPVGVNILLNDATLRPVTNEYAAADIAMADTGGVVVYQGASAMGGSTTANGSELLARRLNAEGMPNGNAFRVNTTTRGDQVNPSVAIAANGAFLVVWDGHGTGDLQGIFAQRFNADGTANGPEFRVNADPTGRQYQPEVAMNATGEAVVVWHGSGSGDNAGIFARRISAQGQPVGNDILVNTTTAGEQAYASVGIDAAGNFVVTWSSRSATTGWDIQLQRFDPAGVRQGTETQANTFTSGSQVHSTVERTADGDFVIGWSSFQQDGDGWGVYSRHYNNVGVPRSAEQAVHTTTAGHQRDIAFALADAGDFLATWTHGQPNGQGWEVQGKVFHADGDGSGAAFTINETFNNANRGNQRSPVATINGEGVTVVAFQARGGNLAGVAGQRYQIDLEPPENRAPDIIQVSDQTITASQQFQITVTATDANSRDTLTFRLDTDQSPSGATITKTGDRTAVIRWQPGSDDRNTRVAFRVLVDDNGQPPLGDAMQFFVNVQNAAPVVDLNGSASGIDRTATLTQGATSVALTNDQLTITDSDQTTLALATVSINIPLDGAEESLAVDTTGTNITQSYNSATGTLTLSGTDLVSNYQRVLRTLQYVHSGTTPSAGQRRVEVTVNDGSASSPPANIVLTVQGPNASPTLAPLSQTTLLARSPLHIPLDGQDADGDTLTYTVTSSNPALVSARVLTGNRSLRMNVQGFGTMVFELFEDRAARATSQIIALAQDGFYEGIIFHRVINDFVIQAGDPNGTGSGGSARPNFDDQFNFELQHNRTGLLSMAKTTDDTNNSQFFITEGPQRHLDFNHTIFGILVEGESVRDAISNVTTNSSGRPATDVVISSMEVFTDNENGVIMLDAAQGSSGSAAITVEVSDGKGGTATRQFNVTVQPDTINGAPFLADIPTIQTTVNTPVTFQLVGRDVEGDSMFYLDEEALTSRGLFLPVASHPDIDYSVNPLTGLVTVTPRNGLQGTFSITVAVAASLDNLTANSPIDYQVAQLSIRLSPA